MPSNPRNPRPGRDHECPHCHAAPGDACHTPTGRPSPPHKARRDITTNPPPTGRKLLLTPELTDTITASLRLGAPLNIAVLAAGTTTTTIYRWLAQADADDPNQPSLFRDFRDAVTQARAQGGLIQLSRINQAAARHIKSEEPVVVVGPDGKGHAVLGPDGNPLVKRVWEQDWRASAFILERSFARDFGRREIVELTGVDSAEAALSASGPAGSDGAGLDRLVASMAAFRERKLLEEAGQDGQVGEDGQPIEDAELVE